MISEFIETFYQTISFNNGEKFKNEKFKQLFTANATLYEKIESEYKTKTVNEHIEEFEYVIENYPDLFLKGFKEHQIECEITKEDSVYLVKSKYCKKYARNDEDLVEYGTNNFKIITEENYFKITSVTW